MTCPECGAEMRPTQTVYDTGDWSYWECPECDLIVEARKKEGE